MRKYRVERPHEAVSTCKHPERSAVRTLGDIHRGFYAEVGEWPNRDSLARSIRMQEKREGRNGDWVPVVKLGLCEGY